MQRRKTRRQFLEQASGALALAALPVGAALAQQADPAYQSGRRSLCEQTPPPGKSLTARKTDTGIQAVGNQATRLLTFIAEAGKLKGGTLSLCAEYGRIEVMDSDDGQVRLQVRCTATGEGAAKALADTDVRVHLTADNGQLRVAVWHATQGFGAQSLPCAVNIRLQVPPTGAYKLDALANHGCVGVHRLTLAGAKLRGLSGTKMRGIKGYQGGHDLDNVVLAGDLDLETSAPAGFGDTWIQGTLTAIASCKVVARTNEGSIRLAFPSVLDTGLDVTASSEQGRVMIGLNDKPAGNPDSANQKEWRARSEGYEKLPIKITVEARSKISNVTVVG